MRDSGVRASFNMTTSVRYPWKATPALALLENKPPLLCFQLECQSGPVLANETDMCYGASEDTFSFPKRGTDLVILFFLP